MKPPSANKILFSIALIGPYPPPIGGVSIHIKRLHQALLNNGIKSRVFNLGGKFTKEENIIPIGSFFFWLFRYLVGKMDGIIHYHGESWLTRSLLLLVRLRKKRIIYTFHSLREEFASLVIYKRLFVRLVAKYGDHFIASGIGVKETLIRFGFPVERISVIPPFLPPKMDDQDFDAIPSYVWNFINTHDPILTANAFRISFFQGEDLYGIDMCVRLCSKLKQQFPNIGLVFCLPDKNDENYFNQMMNMIQELEIGNNFLFVIESIELYPILSRSNLFLRPTNTDSYGISVAEALFLGIPAVASDVCERPYGSSLFHNRDEDEFKDAVLHQLHPGEGSSIDKTEEGQRQLLDLEYLQDLLNLYQRIDNEKYSRNKK
jgi:glycosyltransferase involved in cell wall biosynthesis